MKAQDQLARLAETGLSLQDRFEYIPVRFGGVVHDADNPADSALPQLTSHPLIGKSFPFQTPNLNSELNQVARDS